MGLGMPLRMEGIEGVREAGNEDKDACRVRLLPALVVVPFVEGRYERTDDMTLQERFDVSQEGRKKSIREKELSSNLHFGASIPPISLGAVDFIASVSQPRQTPTLCGCTYAHVMAFKDEEQELKGRIHTCKYFLRGQTCSQACSLTSSFLWSFISFVILGSVNEGKHSMHLRALGRQSRSSLDTACAQDQAASFIASDFRPIVATLLRFVSLLFCQSTIRQRLIYS